VNKNITLAAVFCATLFTVGCASRGAKSLPPPPSDADTGAGISTSSTSGAGIGDGSIIATPTTTNNTGALDLSANKVYFDYDSAEIDTAGQGVISNYGRFLAGSAGTKVRLEGHTDERGSAEYNIALGERRAQTVARELKALGAVDSQLSIISYGKERPAVPGSSEAAYAKNRRVEITQP